MPAAKPPAVEWQVKQIVNLDEDDNSEPEQQHHEWFTAHIDTIGTPKPLLLPRSPTSADDLNRRQAAIAKANYLVERYSETGEFDILPASKKGTRKELKSVYGEKARVKNLVPKTKSAPNVFNDRPSEHSISSDGSRCLQPCANLRRILDALKGGHSPKEIETLDVASPENAVIIFDWDDTLFPTTFITSTVMVNQTASERGRQLYECSPHYSALEAHANLVHFVLKSARKLSRVAIVTLALDPWVISSARLYLPKLDLPSLLKELQIEVYYSRDHIHRIPVLYSVDTFEIVLDRSTGGKVGVDVSIDNSGGLLVRGIGAHGLIQAWNEAHPESQVLPGDEIHSVNDRQANLVSELRAKTVLRVGVHRKVPDRDVCTIAKRQDMEKCLTRLYPRSPQYHWNVLSIGDSHAEQEALQGLIRDKDQTDQKLCKTVHLLAQPSAEQLSNELRILMVWLPHMVQQDKDFDMNMNSLDFLERELLEE